MAWVTEHEVQTDPLKDRALTRRQNATIAFCFLGAVGVAIVISLLSPPIGYQDQLNTIISQQATTNKLLTDLLKAQERR
jgi:hypothetical protein